MKLSFHIFILVCLSVLLTSAVCINRSDISPAAAQSDVVSNPGNNQLHKARKFNFFQRLGLRLLMKRYKSGKGVNADKLANSSLLLGILACSLILLGLLVPVLLILAIPAGVAAMITGGSAVRNKTSLVGKAKTGKAFGLAALIAFGLLLILVILALAVLLAAL